VKEDLVNINLKNSGQNTVQKGRPPIKSTRIEEDIRARLERGEWNQGDLLPTEADLTAHYGVSRMTLRQAMNPLEEEGLIIRKRGKGTFAGDVGKGHSSLGPIAVILNDSQIEEELSYHDQLGRGVRMGLEGENVPLIHYHLPQERGSLMDLVENDPLQASQWGGILTLPCFIDSPSLVWAEKNHIPLVCFSEPLDGQQVSFVELDHEAGGAMAMDYLIRSGRTKPLIIDNRGESSYARGRERGIRRALKSHGIEREERFFWITGTCTAVTLRNQRPLLSLPF
jgi:DNA-binding LacI/PurR family transcriptional regulator